MKGSHPLQVVYDDSVQVPLEVSSVIGVTSFGDILRRRERLSTTIRAYSEEAGLGEMLHVREREQLAHFEDVARRHPEELLYLVLPAHLAPTAARDDAVLFLKKLRYLTEPVALWQGERSSGACLVDRDGLLGYLAEAQLAASEGRRWLGQLAARLPPVDDALGLADLSDLAVTLEYLSGSFSARHFNQVAQDSYHVVKRSHDRDKIRREYRFFGFLPEIVQPYFLQPFDYREEPDEASYRMRRLFVPDLAVQWVHRAFTEAQFEQLLAHLFHFIDLRPRRDVGREAAAADAQELYVDKLAARIDRLLELPAGQAVDRTLVAGGVDGGVRGIHERYLRAYGRIARRRGGDRELCVSHGDLCFSNILYSPSSQTFQLIDPRGADREEEVYGDRYYDVVKLSHSVLGGYDFIVAGLYELVHRDDLGLALEIDHTPAEELQSRFTAALEDHGFDVGLVRVREASLFLSMLPLHLDAPKRVAAFALRAAQILDELGEP